MQLYINNIFRVAGDKALGSRDSSNVETCCVSHTCHTYVLDVIILFSMYFLEFVVYVNMPCRVMLVWACPCPCNVDGT